jgi:hypothetical protein
MTPPPMTPHPSALANRLWATAPPSVVHPCNLIHDDRKGHEAKKRWCKTVHRCLAPPRSLEKVDPSEVEPSGDNYAYPKCHHAEQLSRDKLPETNGTTTKFPKSVKGFANNSRCFCCVGLDRGLGVLLYTSIEYTSIEPLVLNKINRVQHGEWRSSRFRRGKRESVLRTQWTSSSDWKKVGRMVSLTFFSWLVARLRRCGVRRGIRVGCPGPGSGQGSGGSRIIGGGESFFSGISLGEISGVVLSSLGV